MRHQREVHRWHQTTKSRLFCPYPDCVRSVGGEGFSRKENLEEHKRRRHPDLHPPSADHDTDASVDDHPNKKRKRFITPVPSDDSPKADSPSVDAEPSDHPDGSEHPESDEGPIVKRLRQDLDDARHEIRRLATENDALRRQMTQYYSFMSQAPLQVYPVGQGQEYIPQQMAYGAGYGGMQAAYKK
jgi:hypothetical protein